jgi:cyanoexosortase B-associated protein
MSLPIPASTRLPLSELVLLVLLGAFVAVGAVPGYLAQQWSWQQAPPVTTLAALQRLATEGLPIASWPMTQRQVIEVGNHPWLQQQMVNSKSHPTQSSPSSPNSNPTAELMLFPQQSAQQQPQVEWVDLDSFRRWRTDSHQILNVPLPEGTGTMQTRFFRAWTSTHTYAVMQWYAQPQGGHPAPFRWYLADRLAQWQRRRVPWVAVSLQIPMAPLDALTNYRSTIEPVAQAVQAALRVEVLRSPASPQRKR